MKKILILFIVLASSLLAQDGYYYFYRYTGVASQGSVLVPGLPQDQIKANWDFSLTANITLRGGSTVGVRSVKSVVGISPDMDLVTVSNSDQTYDPQLKTGAVSIGAMYGDVSSPGNGGQSMKITAGAAILTASPYTMILVCTPKYTTADIYLGIQQYGLNTGFIVRTAATNIFGTYFGNNATAVVSTLAPAADIKILIYVSQDANGNWEMFTNNESGKTTLATTPKTPSNSIFQLQREGYGSIVWYHQLIVYNKALTTQEKADALANLNAKWSIWNTVDNTKYYTTSDGKKFGTSDSKNFVVQ